MVVVCLDSAMDINRVFEAGSPSRNPVQERVFHLKLPLVAANNYGLSANDI